MNIFKMIKKENLIDMISYTLGLVIVLFLFVFLITSTWIGLGVRERCKMARQKYGGECVESLILFLNDESNDFRSRNSSIWALGQIGDNRALPILRKYFTGNIPNREPIDKTISQYELKKAINLIESGFNLSAFVWR